jgi:SpoVK/Ycf46/Vps4 family AAA+-type ATPase
MSIDATWNTMYNIMEEVTGVSRDELPQRVFRLRAGNLLSSWFGQTEKEIDRFFDELIQMSRQKWTAPDGNDYELPVLAIIEEVDGLARARGGDHIYDRVLTSFLQRLDPNRADLLDRLIVFIGTTNVPDQIDTAFLRRIGSNIEKFGRLDRSGFTTVLEKQISRLPVTHSRSGRAREAVVSDITAWLFSRNGSDPGVVELTYAGSTTPDIRYRRDFLTGALVNRAVRQASERAANDAYEGLNGAGIHLEHLVEAIDRQIISSAEQMSEHNATRFVEIPDGARIANIRRLPQPGQFPMQLQSN